MGIKGKSQTSTGDYWRFLGFLLGFLFLVILIFGYVATEINTNLYAKEISNVDELCQTEKNPDLKYIKVLKYEKSAKRAEIYCIYEDSNKNLDLDMSYRDGKWQAYLTTKLNKDRNFYWPVYV